MKVIVPSPLRPLVWLLRQVSSEAAANAVIGDILEELTDRRASGRAPRHPALWVNLQMLQALGLEMLAALPRLVRSAGLIQRDAVRAMLAAPGHSVFVMLVLAAGIGVGTLTYSVVDAVVLKPLPIHRPERLVSIPTRDQDFKLRITPEIYWRLRDQLGSVEMLAARMNRNGEMATVAGVKSQVTVAHASADVFGMLRLSPGVGRLWTADDEAQGHTDVAVLGYRFWRQQLGGDPSVLGKDVTVGKRTYTIVGVLSAASDHPEVGDLTNAPVWVPMVVPRTSSQSSLFGIVGRMRPGVTLTQVAADVQRLADALDWEPAVARLHDGYVAGVRQWMLLALAAAGLVVLVACANAANLMLTRSAARSHEMAIRASLGASRRQIVLAVLEEGLLLSLGATAISLLGCIAGVRVARFAVISALPWMFRASEISLNGRVLAAAAATAALTGLLFSLVPAWHTSRAPLSSLLKDSDTPTATGRRRWRSTFLTAEIATVVVLVVVSWLFVASLIHATSIDLGIDRANLVAVMPRLEFRAPVDEVRQRIENVPGVSGIALSRASSLPLFGRAFHGAWWTTTLERAEGASGSAPPLTALQYRVTPNYFAVAGVPFRRGGTWDADSATAASVVVLDELAARALFGDEDPIGRPVRANEPAGVFTVVGTVPHVYARGPEEAEQPAAYFNLRPEPARMFAGLLVRTSRPPEEMVPLLSELLGPVGPDLQEPFVFAGEEAVRRLTASRRFNAALMSVFGIVAMLLGAAGVYATMASVVAQQTREIGVRVALGATPGRIQRGVLAMACRHLLVGLGLGVPLAWWLSRGFAALLFQVSPADASVYIGVCALVSVVGCLAAWVPGRRAARIDPLVSLRR
jgi:putative ABC transport system permease protein